ncbi:hypothetical protein [Clostridium rectalis]|uniref:hypothetical protein n=1 Tax=Clostridium rectalis TaxID=2040295 RepID=UPI000F641ABD|nr:hypothetical protein [Clostridium rectalis]
MVKYELPFNFDIKLLDFITEKIDKDWVEFLFLAPFKEDSKNARSHLEGIDKKNWTYTVPITRDDYSFYIKEIQKRGLKPAVLFQEEKPIDYSTLDYYLKLGVDNFVVNSDELAKMIKNLNPKFKVVASITKTLSATNLWENDYSMYDKIVLHFPFNRALSRINKLPNFYKYTLLVNSYCLYNCSIAKKHWASTNENYSNINCLKNQHKDDLIYIPPEYVNIFEPFVDSFKIQGREYKTDILKEEIYCYYKNIHNPMAGVIYNRLSSFNAEEYFNKGKDLKFVIYDNPHNNLPQPA